MRKRIAILLLSVLGVAQCAMAYVVHLVQQVEVDGVIVETIDETHETGDGFSTSNAVERSGYIFTHWSTSVVQDFGNRDPWGRAYEQVEFSLYEPMTNTAHYVRADLDSDADGMADALEIYWYGNLNETPLSDTDGDGLGFKRELETGYNPHFKDDWQRGVLITSKTPQFFKIVLRSEPEGTLFATEERNVAPGVAVRTSAYNPNSSKFAYWTKEGVSQRDMFGRALDQLQFEMPTNDVELVAVTADDEETRQAVYWTGDAANGWESDMDKDGMTLREEVARGTNPLFADRVVGGVKVVSRAPQFFKLILRSEPEGALFATEERNVAPGVAVRTGVYNPGSSAFAHWTKDGVSQRDMFGRALDQLQFEMPTNDVELVAVTADDEETRQAVYWTGDAANGWESDTDKDGMSLREEIARGTNPLFADKVVGGVKVVSRAPQFFKLVLRSEPEGVLFATEERNVAPGVSVRTSAYNPNSSAFAHWTKDGLSQRDMFGRALDQLQFEMPTNDVELVAVVLDDEEARQALYWTGDAANGWESDTDKDGMSLREEIARGTNPLFADDFVGGIKNVSRVPQFFKLVLRSEPEGVLFATEERNVAPGVAVRTSAYEPNTSVFAYWIMDGVSQRDMFGRALDQLLFEMPTYDVEVVAVALEDEEVRQALYWTSDAANGWDSDTDKDGMTLREEVARGTNPIFYDEYWARGVQYVLSEEMEVDLQPFEQMRGTIVDGEYSELFTSPLAGNNGASFGESAAPLAMDVNGDGLFDLVVVSQGGVRVLVNKGAAANPDFTEMGLGDKWDNFKRLLAGMTRPLICGIAGYIYVSDNGGIIYRFTIADGSVADMGLAGIPVAFGARLVALTAEGGFVCADSGQTIVLDTPVIDGLSAACADIDADGRMDILVSDRMGHIWLYRNVSAQWEINSGKQTLKLLHKVWAGTGVGFAEGMTISLVDWEDDGDFDVVIGTADGKLMLLRDPKTGRPTNVRATPGATSVLLEWDPNEQPRIRGYNVYRAPDAESYSRIVNQTPLPRYRDVPNVLQDYWYRVTGVSRFYISGNSTPTVHESMPTDAVYVQFRPSVWLNDTSSFTETNVEVVVSMNNSTGISANGLSMTFAYDPAVLEPIEMKAAGLTDGMALSANGGNGTWTMSATGGEIKTGSGMFMKLVFYVKPVHDVTKTVVSLTGATVKALDGHAVTLELPKSATIEISDANPLVPAVVAVDVADAAVNTETEFILPVTVTSSEMLTNFTAEVAYDESMLRFDGWSGTIGGEDLALKFYAYDPKSVVTNFATAVSLTNIIAVDRNGFTVNAADATATVLIKNVHPLVPAIVSVSTEAAKVDTLTEFELPVAVTSNEELKSGSFTVEYDPAVLEWRGEASALVRAGALNISATESFALKFYAKDQHDVTQTNVRMTDATVVDIHDFVVKPSVPVVATVLIHDANPLLPPKVTMSLSDVSVKTEQEFEMVLSIATTEALKALEMDIQYDTGLLELKSGVLSYSDGVPTSVVLTFYAKENHTVTKTAVTILPKSGVGENGLAAELPTEVVGNVILADSNPWKPAEVSVGIVGAKVDTLTEFELPVAVTSNEELKSGSFTVEYDPAVLEWRGEASALVRAGALNISATESFALKFYAKDQHDVTQTSVRLTEATVTDIHDFVVKSSVPVVATVFIHDVNPLLPPKVTMSLSDVAVKTEQEFEMVLSIATTEALKALGMDIQYDTGLLELKSGVLSYSDGVPASVVLTFYAKENHTVTKTAVTILPKSGVGENGLAAELPAEVVGNVILADSNPWKPAEVSVGIVGAKVDTLTEFELPVTVTSNEELKSGVFTIEYDPAVLEWRGEASALVGAGVLNISAIESFALKFYAKDQHDVTQTSVKITDATVVDIHDFVVKPSVPVVATVLIHDAKPLVPAGVVLDLDDAHIETCSDFTVPITVMTTKTLKELSVMVRYDSNLFEFKGCVGGVWNNGAVTAEGVVPNTILLTFHAKDQHAVTQSKMTLFAASAKCMDNLAATVTMTDGMVYITDSNPPVAPNMSVGTWSVRVTSGSVFRVPIGRTSDAEVKDLTVTVEWDSSLIRYLGAIEAVSETTAASNCRKLTFATRGLYSTNFLEFAAAEITGLQANAWIRLTAASGTGANGLAAKMVNSLPVASTVVIVREIGKYSPGDIDGDGKLTDADLEKLKDYIKYLSIVNAMPSLAGRYDSWKLTGKALTAADANKDGEWNATDVSLLAQWVAEAKEIAE